MAAVPLPASAARQQEQLRQQVFVLLEAAASLPATSSNLPEVTALMQLLRQHPRRHDLVRPACRVLLRLLGCAPATTLAALQDQQLLTALPRLLAQQQEGEPPARELDSGAEHSAAHAAGSPEARPEASEEPLASPRSAAEALGLEDARCAVLELLGAFLRFDFIALHCLSLLCMQLNSVNCGFCAPPYSECFAAQSQPTGLLIAVAAPLSSCSAAPTPAYSRRRWLPGTQWRPCSLCCCVPLPPAAGWPWTA